MKKILAAGVLSQPFGSWPVATQSDDGQIWDEPVPIFSLRDQPTGMATDGTTAAISNTQGKLAITQDMLAFAEIEISPNFGISALGYMNGDWLAAGTRTYTEAYASYPGMSEVAQIYRSPSPYGYWEMVWSHPEIDSRIYQLKWFQFDVTGIWIACGSSGQNGDAWFSIDDGYSWIRAAIPAGIDRITSVSRVEVASQSYWYWGSNGRVFRSTDLQSGEWTQISVDARDTIVDIRQQGEWIVMVGIHAIYSGTDGLIFNTWSYPAYAFDGIQDFDNDGSTQWLIFARSQLITKTHWLTSNFVNFEQGNNNVHIMTSTLAS